MSSLRRRTHTASFDFDAQASRVPIILDESSELTLCGPSLRSIKSFVSVPIVLSNGRHFGALFALDLELASLAEPRIVSMFKNFAALIASQLDHETDRERERTALPDKRATSELREQFIAIVGHDLRNPLQAVFASGDLLERRLTDRVASAYRPTRSAMTRMSSPTSNGFAK